MEVKKQILASQISVKRTLQNERAMERELSKFFKRLKGEVLSALKEYWSEYQLLQGQINLMVAPVHEAHKEYYEILEKYVKREYKLGQAEAKRNVERLQRKNRVAFKATTPMPIKGFINHNKYDLFETSPRAERDLLDRTFRASEQTMNRVDNQINNIITDGYRSGKGINDIGSQLSKRFDQLSSWESRRIARTEVNTSHNVATRDTYKDLGVEYTQWIAASDDRTRDSHLEVDGEIIPIDGKYSNGLGYPGDMSGPIEEWINCRCSNAPFVVPFGYMAPSFSPFRESDLIPINDEIGQEPTPEQLTDNLSDAQRALYDKYQREISEANKVLDNPLASERERLQAGRVIESNTSKLNQLRNTATGAYGNQLTRFIGNGATAAMQVPTDEQLKANLTKQELEEVRWAKSVLSKDFHTEMMKQRAQSTLDELYSKALKKPLPKSEKVPPQTVDSKPLKPKTKTVEEQPVKPKVQETSPVDRMSSQELYESMTKADKKKYDKFKGRYESAKKYDARGIMEHNLLKMREMEQKQRTKLQNKGKRKPKTEPVRTNERTLDNIHKEVEVPTEELIPQLEKWIDKRCKNTSEFGYHFDVKTGKLMGDEIRGKKGRIKISDEGSNAGSIHSHPRNGMSAPSIADLETFRCKKEQHHFMVSEHEIWYVKATDNFGIGGMGQQLDLQSAHKACRDRAFETVSKLVKKGKIEATEEALAKALDKYTGDELLKTFNKPPWNKTLTVKRYYR